MKVLVVYDSVYGNTEKIAHAVSSALKDEVRVIRVGSVNPSELEKTDLLIIGSPTNGGKPLKPVMDFVESIPESALKNRKVAVFDTRLTTRWVGVFGYAAGKLGSALKSKGGNLLVAPEAFFVKGTKGPLKDGELERAANWAKDIIFKAETGKEL